LNIIADLHTHTIACTHAYSTITENCACAYENGMKAIAMTDHAPSMPDAPHIWHFNNLHILPRKIKGVTVLRGIEADILPGKEALDVDGELLSTLDWVVASIHSPLFIPSDSNAVTNAYLRICENRYVDVIGHPTTLKFRFDMVKCIKRFKEYGKMIELNESSISAGRSTAEICRELLLLCKKYEVPVVVNTDAHFCELVGRFDLCREILDSVSFPEELVFNSEWDKVRQHIINKHGDIGI